MRMPRGHFWGAQLFVPANRAGFLTRLPLLPARAIILDLEYATRWPAKAEARFLAAEAIGYLRELRPELTITVRINMPAAGRLAERDLDVVAPAQPAAIRVPTVEDPAAVARICERLGAIESRAGLELGGIRLHPMIETPRGLARVSEIARASPRVEALCLGGEDWAHNVGATRTPAGRELDYVRSALVAAAAEHGLVAVDTVYRWLDDLEGLAADCQHGKALGFRGRATINPRQLAVIERIYQPDPQAVAAATSMLEQLVEVRVDDTTLHLIDGVITDPSAIFQARLTHLSGSALA